MSLEEKTHQSADFLFSHVQRAGNVLRRKDSLQQRREDGAGDASSSMRYLNTMS